MENILFDEQFNPKICDFGFAAFNEEKLNEYIGTITHAAPEIFLHNPYDGFKADIFSLGVILFSLITCKSCFEKATRKDPDYYLIKNEYYKKHWNYVVGGEQGVSDEFKKLFYKMVSFNPQDRPSIEDIVNDD